jgi:hypothetical protein
MSHVAIVNRSQVFAAATAITALGFLTVPTPAQADPRPAPPSACSQYAFDGPFIINESGSKIYFESYGTAARGNVDSDTSGHITGGGIQGRNVDFTIHWDSWVGPDGKSYPSGLTEHFTGTVGDDANVYGVATLVGYGSQPWNSIRPLVCNDPAAPPPPGPQVVLAPGVKDPPPHELGPQSPPATPPPAKPLQGPTVSATPGITGVTFHVTDRSGVASQCTYSSEGFTSGSFSLPANGSFDLFVPAIREFRNRTGTITCDNGTSAGTSVNF